MATSAWYCHNACACFQLGQSQLFLHLSAQLSSLVLRSNECSEPSHAVRGGRLGGFIRGFAAAAGDKGFTCLDSRWHLALLAVGLSSDLWREQPYLARDEVRSWRILFKWPLGSMGNLSLGPGGRQNQSSHIHGMRALCDCGQASL